MAGQLTIDTLKASSGVLATQNGMTGIAKAWCNYNGATSTITGSYNISSVTKNGTGDYTFNFSTAMPNSTYVTLTTASDTPTAGTYSVVYGSSQTTSSVRCLYFTSGGAGNDRAASYMAVLSS